ncbi:L-ornithine N(5)-monooxygenase 1 [Colletotrichum chlorophyti]|uniref:L-ornithine N(5)-monooxygenase [NAD(P)H] n=1 Tax=Colletotrichum chlorophyti TaxID=708187 RepID=A0A1Q8S648_9PEZI|nr:L-ornithine N(5)-monooxygenase 1 [Colletotrichum chlorophyti]
MAAKHILFLSAHDSDAVIRDGQTWLESTRHTWGLLFDALEERGATFELRSFKDATLTASYIAGHYTHVIVLTAEYYHDYADTFEIFFSSTLSSAKLLNPRLRVLNSAASVLWNLEKGYLKELQEALDVGQIQSPSGIRIRLPQTTFLPRQSDAPTEREQLAKHLSSLPSDVPVFVKPSIGASSHGAFLISQPHEQDAGLIEKLAETCSITHSNDLARVMVQEFLSNITSTGTHGGEWGVYMVAGKPIHATSRRPAPGDTRTGEDFGGGGKAVPISSAPPAAVDAAVAIWQWLETRFDKSPDLMYARIDGIMGSDGEFVVLELEMIEPWFWFGTEASRDAPTVLCNAILGDGTEKPNGVDGKVSQEQEAKLNGLPSTSRPAITSVGVIPAVGLDEVHDLICVGFGPANLAIAAALHDMVASDEDLQAPKVLFLEKQSEFAWHSGMMLPGSRMQIPFIKDIAAPRNPQSQFTFTNYLHKKGRLIDFSNLGTLYPLRLEFADYLKWCASFFDENVRYNSRVLAVRPVEHSPSSQGISTFEVVVEQSTGNIVKLRGKNIVIGLGGQPSIPKSLSFHHPRIIHSSQFAHLATSLLSHLRQPRVAVIGGGQSAAEILDFVQSNFAQSQTYLITQGEFLKPSDDSPLISVNEIFNPEFIDDYFTRSQNDRQALLNKVHSTNYSVINLDLIERIYGRIYEQKIMLGCDESQWPHKFLNSCQVVKAEGNGTKGPLTIHLNHLGSRYPAKMALEVDVIVAATGYRRTAHLDMLAGLEPLLEKENGASGLKPDVTRDYRVKFLAGKVMQGSGVWLQGCCEETHGISDTLLSVVASRSELVMKSMFPYMTSDDYGVAV